MKEELVEISINGKTIQGDLTIPPGSKGIVIFAHGAGSSRSSPRNKFVAEHLHEAGLATLLIDLLTEEEKETDRQTREHRFDIDRLSERVIRTIEWAANQESTEALKIGLFGSSTGAAGALIGAAKKHEKVEALVSRGGRVDLAEDFLKDVQAPTLCLVGGRDIQVLAINRQAIEKMEAPAELKVIEGAGHLFEEPGAMDEVARLTQEWFEKFLTN